MHDRLDQTELDDVRKRLYSRGTVPKVRDRTRFTDEQKNIPASWPESSRTDVPQKKEVESPVEEEVRSISAEEDLVTNTQLEESMSIPSATTPMPTKNKRKKYRIRLILAGIVFFVGAVATSSIFILLGNNAISGENIAVSITGPFTIGGGEVIPLQIGVTNQNTIAIEAATLIIEYPSGTKSIDDPDKELYIERLPLEIIASGQAINISLRAQVFGEENEELTIKASIEYRVKDSNATFFKKAEPLRFKISSSPVVVSIDAVRNISSGQEVEIDVTVYSNAPAPLTNILVKAEYPIGFDFTSSNPRTDSGQNIWAIEKLQPDESVTISLKGIVVGNESDESVMHFSVGVPSERDSFSITSIFATAQTEFEVEQAFLDIGIAVNGSEEATAAITTGDSSQISIVIKNTLEDSIYDGVVTAALSGNALSDTDVSAPGGFYDSNTKTIIWDISSMPTLEQIGPGATEQFSFTITPAAGTTRTPKIDISASMSARRVSENRVSEELTGTANATIQVESNVRIIADTAYSASTLTGSGPIPPEVGQTTTYTLALRAENGSNGISDVVTTATLPSYITWVDTTAGSGVFAYNDSTREVTWTIGSMEADGTAMASFQVSILPSVSHIDTTPTVLGEQRMRTTDKFTGTVIRASHPALTTVMSTELGFGENNGYVQSANN